MLLVGACDFCVNATRVWWCVCVCVRERERERESVCVSVCQCVCVWSINFFSACYYWVQVTFMWMLLVGEMTLGCMLLADEINSA